MTADLALLTAATWPAASELRLGPWVICDGQGGGQRVSATRQVAPFVAGDIPLAEAAMDRLGQDRLFVIWPGQEALDQALAARGYGVKDPVTAYAAPTAQLADPDAPPLAAFAHWPPLGIARALWAEAGTSRARLAVMERAAGPKVALLGRTGDRAAGVAFVACHGSAAMLHALEVAPDFRRQKVAHHILRAAANWALDQGATRLFVLVTQANRAANQLYASLKMEVVGHYHYRRM